jgi:hypothetical protein
MKTQTMKNQTLTRNMLFIAVCSLASSICLANEVSYSVDVNVDAQTSHSMQADTQSGSIALGGSLQQQQSVSNQGNISAEPNDAGDAPLADDSNAEAPMATNQDAAAVDNRLNQTLDASTNAASNLSAQVQNTIANTNAAVVDVASNQVNALMAIGAQQTVQQNIQQNVQSALNNSIDNSVNTAVANSIDSTINNTIQSTIDDTIESTVESSVTTALNNSLGLGS